jgi:hypothetical protein
MLSPAFNHLLCQSILPLPFVIHNSGPARRPQIMVGIIVFGSCLGSKSNIQTYDLICRDVAFAESNIKSNDLFLSLICNLLAAQEYS